VKCREVEPNMPYHVIDIEDFTMCLVSSWIEGLEYLSNFKVICLCGEVLQQPLKPQPFNKTINKYLTCRCQKPMSNESCSQFINHYKKTCSTHNEETPSHHTSFMFC